MARQRGTPPRYPSRRAGVKRAPCYAPALPASDRPLRIDILTTNGVTREFRSWPERLQARALVHRGHAVRAFAYRGDRAWNTVAREEIDGVDVRRVARRGYWSGELLREATADPPPDVLHVHHLSNQLAFLGTVLARRRRVPVVFTPHGPFHDPWLVGDRDRPFDAPPRYADVVQTPSALFRSLGHPRRAVKNFLTHRPLVLADRVIALSEHERGVLRQLGVLDERIAVVPNAIDVDWLEGASPEPRPAGTLRVLFLGQLKYRKGFDLLARAIPRVAARVPQARFVFAGHSPIHRAELFRLLDEGGARGVVDVREETSEAQKAALFLGSDVYVLPTRYEGFGIPLLEAWSAGCAVVTTRLPVLSEIVTDGVTGLLFAYDDPVDLSATIVRALEDAALRRRLAEAGRAEVERYATSRITDRLETVYRELAVARPAPAGA
jgi:glycosyltransferase involved in cell wall biosynthesis